MAATSANTMYRVRTLNKAVSCGVLIPRTALFEVPTGHKEPVEFFFHQWRTVRHLRGEEAPYLRFLILRSLMPKVLSLCWGRNFTEGQAPPHWKNSTISLRLDASLQHRDIGYFIFAYSMIWSSWIRRILFTVLKDVWSWNWIITQSQCYNNGILWRSICWYCLWLYRLNLGINLVEIDAGDDDSQFEIFWQHSDAILCCAWKVASISFIFREVFYNTVNHQPKVGTWTLSQNRR